MIVFRMCFNFGFAEVYELKKGQLDREIIKTVAVLSLGSLFYSFENRSEGIHFYVQNCSY